MTPVPLAFYAPLKPPGHPNPSGDRAIARLLIKALSLAGFTVETASRFRSFDGSGNERRQQRIKLIASKLAQRLVRHYQARPPEQRPKLWFTYHLYHKAPDWIGPRVAQALDIPYVVAEASYAPKQLNGPWHLGVEGSLDAIRQAALVLCLNPNDQPCLQQQFPALNIHTLPPFLDLQSLPTAGQDSRIELAQTWGIDPEPLWLITVAMMRPGDKSHSYRLLSESLERLHQQNWQLLIVGDGKARLGIQQYFSEQPKVCFLGKLAPSQLYPLLQAADLYVWPAVNEAFGMAFLEAQAAGLGILAGREGGVPSIVNEGQGAVLTPPGDPQRFADALDSLLAEPQTLAKMGQHAQRHVHQHHSLESASHRLKSTLEPLLI